MAQIVRETDRQNALLSFTLPIVVMFAVLAVMLVFMCLPIGQVTGQAKAGSLDLRSADLSKSIYKLSGEWQYTPGQLHTFDSFPSDAPVISVPTTWTSESQYLNSCATYRLVVKTNPQYDEAQQLVLFIPEIYTAYRLWINGRHIYDAGVVSDSPEVGEPAFSTTLVFADAHSGELEIVIQASNYHFMRPHMNNLLLLGESETIQLWFYRTRILYGLSMGFILASFFYHLALYILRSKQTIYLLFSLLSLSSFIRFSLETNGISDLMRWFPTSGEFDMRLYMAVFFLHGMLGALFSLYIFDRHRLVRYRLIAFIYCALGVAACVFMPMNITQGPLISFIFMFPFMAFAIYRAARSRVLREDRWMWFYFIALVLFTVVGGVSKFFFDHLLFMPGLLTNLYLIMVQSLILAKEYNDTVMKEQRLMAENAALDRLDQMKTDLMATISHETRTPLAVLSGYAGLISMELKAKGVDEQTAADLDRISLEAQRIAGIMEELQNMSQKKDSEARRGPLDISEVVRQTARLYEPMLERHDISLELDIDEGLPLIFGNPDELTQVLFNLITNTKKHAKSKTITISVKRHDRCIRLIMADTGTGISPELLPHVFEMHVRGKAESTGLGLFICREVVESHGGTISIESKLGKGTAVTIELPEMMMERSDV